MDGNVHATIQSILPPRPLLLLLLLLPSPYTPRLGWVVVVQGRRVAAAREGIDGGLWIGDGRLGGGYNTIRWASA